MNTAHKLMSVLTLAIAVIAFNSNAVAQNTSGNTDQNTIEKRDRQGRFERKGGRGMRDGKRGKDGMRGNHGNRGLMRILSKLDLTDSQKSQIKTIIETERNANQPFRDEAKTLIMKRRDGTITEDEQIRLGEIREQMKSSANQTKNSILALLTPEQIQKLEQIKAEMKDRMKNRRQNKRQRSNQSTETEDN